MNQELKRPIHCDQEVQDNTYHAAIYNGAKWFCMKCWKHLDENLRVIKMGWSKSYGEWFKLR